MIRMADLRVPLTFFWASSSPLRLEHPPGLMTTTSSTTTLDTAPSPDRAGCNSQAAYGLTMQHRTSLTRCRDCCRRRVRGRARRHHAPNRPIALFHHGACRRVCTHAFQETGVVAGASKEASAGSKRVRSCWASTEGGSRLRSYLARTTATRVDDPRAWMAAFKPCLGPTVCGGSLNVAGRSTQVHAAKPWEPRWLLSLFCLCCRPPHPAMPKLKQLAQMPWSKTFARWLHARQKTTVTKRQILSSWLD